MGEEREHSRFTLVTAGGAKSRGVAFRSPPKHLEPARAEPHDIALRLECNRWKGVVEPRVLLRSLCPTRAGELRVLGEEDFWEALRRGLGDAPSPPAGRVAGPTERRGEGLADVLPVLGHASGSAGAPPVDRRGEGFAGVAGDLLTSGEPVLVAVADVPRRRAALENLVAGLAADGMAVVAWGSLADRPALAEDFVHLVALDPPPGGATDPLLGAAPRAHLAWGPAEAEFALAAARAELELRPALADTYRALRDLPDGYSPQQLEAALRGRGRYPRGGTACARLVRVLSELGLTALDPVGRTCELPAATRTELARSPSYREAGERLAAIERALAAELPQRSGERRAA